MLTVALHFCLRNTTGHIRFGLYNFKKRKAKQDPPHCIPPGHIKILGRFFYKRNANELFLSVICHSI